MAVPDFQSLMLPLLKMSSGGGEPSLAEAREALAVDFQLTEADREERLPNGQQAKFANRTLSQEEKHHDPGRANEENAADYCQGMDGRSIQAEAAI